MGTGKAVFVWNSQQDITATAEKGKGPQRKEPRKGRRRKAQPKATDGFYE